MKWVVLACFAVGVLFSAEVDAADFYLSSSSGNDADSGTISNPWKSLSKISSVKLGPGDAVRFKNGDRFDGRFVVNGSGTKDQPIRISSYGEGPLPVITGLSDAGDFREAILVENQQHITFEDIEVQNDRTASRKGVRDVDAFGIHIMNSGEGVLRGFTFKNVTFRSVYAATPVLKEEGESAFNSLEVAGLRFFNTKNRRGDRAKNIQDILIEDCYFNDLQRLGIHIKSQGGQRDADPELSWSKNIIVRNNRFHRTGGTCVLPCRTYNCLIEQNTFEYPGDNSDPRMAARGSSVWTWHCYNTVIQHNTCMHIRGYLDSHGIHIDHANVNTFVQYNYMEDCEGGFVDILGGNSNAVYRFNISVNDGWRENPGWKNSNHTLWINDVVSGEKDHHCSHSYIYNNTVFMDRDFSTAIEMDAKNTFVFNNIFVNNGNGVIGGKAVKVENNGTPLFMKNNLFHGGVSEQFKALDTHVVEDDPEFVDKGKGAERFRLSRRSAALDAGVAETGPPIPGAGRGVFKNLTPYPTEDFFGNAIDLSRGTPTIGAGQ